MATMASGEGASEDIPRGFAAMIGTPGCGRSFSTPETEQPVQHWLDRLFPGVREWLDGKNRQWWLKGVRARCRTVPELEGRDTFITEQLEQQYRTLLSRHHHRAVDERSQTHLQVACLLMATNKVLQPFVRDRLELHNMLQQHMGAQTSPALRFLLKFTLFLTPNAVKATGRRLDGLKLDYGRAFDAAVLETGSGKSLRVTRCFYNDLLHEEGVPELLPCCCCSQDSMWFEGLERFGVGFIRSSWLGQGQSACCLEISSLKNE